MAADGAAAIVAARTPPGQIATLILPADTAWNVGSGPASVPPAAQPAAVSSEAVAEAAQALRSGEPSLLLVTGLRQEGLDLAAFDKAVPAPDLAETAFRAYMRHTHLSIS